MTQASKYYFDNLFPSQYGFHKGYSSQLCLLVTLENVRKYVKKGKEFWTLFTDFPKAFDCVDCKALSRTEFHLSFHS